jgi:PhnB protein
MFVEPYLFFDGRCEEALEFYRTALGAEIGMIMRYRESPEPPPPEMVPEGWDDKIMHALFRVGNSAIMASDDCTAGDRAMRGFSLSIAAADADEAERLFRALADGGVVQMPLGATFWSPAFGMVTDRFGVPWMVNAATVETADG